MSNKKIVACEGSGHKANDIEEGYALCPHCKEVRAVRSDGTIRNHRGKYVPSFMRDDIPSPVAVDEVIIDLAKESPPDETETDNTSQRRSDRPVFIITEIAGVAVGWDTCGKCKRFLQTCSCREPSRPAHIDKMIEREEKRAAQ